MEYTLYHKGMNISGIVITIFCAIILGGMTVGIMIIPLLYSKDILTRFIQSILTHSGLGFSGDDISLFITSILILVAGVGFLYYIIREVRTLWKDYSTIGTMKITSKECIYRYNDLIQKIEYKHAYAISFNNNNAQFYIKEEYLKQYTEELFSYHSNKDSQSTKIHCIDIMLLPLESPEVIGNSKKWSEEDVYRKIRELSQLSEMKL